MKYNNRYRQEKPKAITCSCGGNSKLTSKSNYPFGKKSKAIKSTFYKCSECNKATFVKEEKNNRR